LEIFSITFIFAPYISITGALLSRNYQFDLLMVTRLSSQLASVICTIIVIYLDYSYLSLAYGVLLGGIVELVILLFIRPSNFQVFPKFTGLQPIVRFGALSSMAGLLQRFDTAICDLVIGKIGTPTEVAMVSRGTGLMLFISQVLVLGIKPVSLPYLSQVRRDGGCLRDAYIKASLLLGSICLPILIVVGIASYPTIVFMFGEQWKDAVPIAQILTIWVTLGLLHTLSPTLMMAAEKEGLMLIKQSIVFVFMLIGILISYPYGLQAVAWAMVLAACIDFLISSWTVYKTINLSIFKFLLKMFPNFILCITCGGATLVINLNVNFLTYPPIKSLIIISIVLPIVWLTSVKIINHPIRNELSRLPIGLLKKYI
jgi:O-antigen/teichoic acid export membrane protein